MSIANPPTEAECHGTVPSGDAAPRRRGRPLDTAKADAILAAASQLFINQGFAATSMDAIAAAAGVAKATIYARHTDKDALFTAVLLHNCATMVQLERLDAPGPLAERLEAFARRFLDLILSAESLGMHRVVFAECGREPRVAQLFYDATVRNVSQRFAAFLRAETAAGRLAVPDADGLALRFLGAVLAEPQLRAMVGLPPAPADAMAAHIRGAVDDLIRAYGSTGAAAAAAQSSRVSPVQ